MTPSMFWDIVRAAEPLITLIVLAITVGRLDAALKRIEALEKETRRGG